MIITISESFVDYDGVNVSPGVFFGQVVIRGRKRRRKGQRFRQFWNIIANGRIVAVTVGFPPHTSVGNRDLAT